MIECLPVFETFQCCVERQSLTGGIVILQYQARAVAREFVAAVSSDSEGNCCGGFLLLPEALVERSRDVTSLIGPALLAKGHLGWDRGASSRRADAIRHLQAAGVTVVHIPRHRKVPAQMLLDLLQLVETGRELGHPVVFILSTAEASKALVAREPSLAAEASVVHVGPIARAELIGLLQFLDFKGTGLATLARLSAGDASVALKILSTLERQGYGKDDLSRDAVEAAFRDLRLGTERRDAA
jgi:hypothetical protein